MKFKIVKTGNKFEAIVTRIQRNDGIADGDVVIPNGITKVLQSSTAHLQDVKIGRVILPPSIEVVEAGTFENHPNLIVLVGSQNAEDAKRENLPQSILQGFADDAQIRHISSASKVFDFKIDAEKFFAKAKAKTEAKTSQSTDAIKTK